MRARYGPVPTSSDVSGVVVMVSRSLAVPNEPRRANCELRVFYKGGPEIGKLTPMGFQVFWGSEGGR